MLKATEQEPSVPVTHLVECYRPWVTRAAVREALGRTDAAAAKDIRRRGSGRACRSTFVPGAACPDTIREATEQGALSAGRISVAEDLVPPDGRADVTVDNHARM